VQQPTHFEMALLSGMFHAMQSHKTSEVDRCVSSFIIRAQLLFLNSWSVQKWYQERISVFIDPTSLIKPKIF